MSRRKKSTAKQPPGSNAKPIAVSQDAASARTGQDAGQPMGQPSGRIRLLITILVVFHLAAISLSMTAVVASSDTQAKLNGWLQPYTMPTHFRTQGERLFLTAGEESESPLRIQVQRRSSKPITVNPLNDETIWETVQPQGIPGLGANDRYTRWLTSVMTLVNSESPSLVAELLLPMVRGDESITAVRIVRLSSDLSLEYEEDLVVPYTAVVVRSGESAALVRVNEARLSTFNTEAEAIDSAGSVQ